MMTNGAARGSIVNQILQFMPEPPATFTLHDVVNAVQGKRHSIKSALTNLKQSGRIKVVTEGRGKTISVLQKVVKTG